MSKTGLSYIICGVWFALLTHDISAQHHVKNSAGQVVLSKSATASGGSARAGAARTSGSQVVRSDIRGGDTILPAGAAEAFRENRVRLGQMKEKQVDIWGRAIHHSDGSYTESKQDILTNTLEQETKSKNGVRLQRRVITLDEVGRPAEALIYDGRDQFKYRGLQIYDTFGRFAEEQLYDAKNTLIRRKVQEYSPRGEKLPLRSWDYVANIPDDLKLVITREDAGSLDSTATSGTNQKVAKSTSNTTKAAPAASPSHQVAHQHQTSEQGNSSGPKKGLKLKGIFGSKRNN